MKRGRRQHTMWINKRGSQPTEDNNWGSLASHSTVQEALSVEWPKVYKKLSMRLSQTSLCNKHSLNGKKLLYFLKAILSIGSRIEAWRPNCMKCLRLATRRNPKRSCIISTDGCQDVDDFIKAIKKKFQLPQTFLLMNRLLLVRNLWNSSRRIARCLNSSRKQVDEQWLTCFCERLYLSFQNSRSFVNTIWPLWTRSRRDA